MSPFRCVCDQLKRDKTPTIIVGLVDRDNSHRQRIQTAKNNLLPFGRYHGF